MFWRNIIYSFSFNIIIIILFTAWFSISLFGKANTLYVCVRQKWSTDTRRLSGIDFPPDDFQRSPTNCAQHMPAFLSHARQSPLPRKCSRHQLIRKFSEKSLYVWPNPFKVYKRAFPSIFSNKKILCKIYYTILKAKYTTKILNLNSKTLQDK